MIVTAGPAGKAVCDECIAERLRLPASSTANKHTRELAGMDGFERLEHICSLCGAPRGDPPQP